jgi:glutathione S-transferase
MKIYEFKDFPNPRRVRIFLAEKGIVNVTFEQVNVPNGEHRSEAFKAKNPLAGVPVLELDDGTCISETVAISRYFEEKYPEPPLMGTIPQEKAEIEMWQRRVEYGLMETVAAYFHHATPGLGELETYQNVEWGQKNREKAVTTIQLLDKVLWGRTFIAGEKFSIADITGLCAVDFAAFVKIAIPEDCLNVKRWYAEISSRSSAKA